MKAYATQAKWTAAIAVVGALLLAVGYQFYGLEQQKPTKNLEPAIIIPQIFFQFDVYCPVDSAERLAAINEALGFDRSALDFDYNANQQVFVVIAKTQPSDSNDASSAGGLYYCGFARKWWQPNCNHAKLVCSIPGPMFYFPMRQEATIIFVNDVNTKTVNWAQDNCYDPASDDRFCTVTSKAVDQGCSYFQPTDYSAWATGSHRVDEEAVPISPHIHGMEIRPTFDGNPLSWFNTAGDTGPGFNTLYNDSYYSLFNDKVSFRGKRAIDPALAKRSKVIQVTNDQLPGMMFYHDHAMKSTLYNVQNGFSGIYIVYDDVMEAPLPKGEFQKIVVFAKPGDARIFVSENGLHDSGHNVEAGNYRIRMLNAHFDNVYQNISFVAYYDAVQDESGKTTYIEYDPASSPDFDLSAHQHRIPFSVIGTDTTIFNTPVNDLDQVTLGSAERADILINFAAYLPPGIQYIYIICYDTKDGLVEVKYRFNLPWETLQQSKHLLRKQKQTLKEQMIVQDNNEKQPYLSDPNYLRSLQLAVPFTDLSLIPDSKIATKRYRPLFSLPFDTRFMIGAHYMFQMGATDNPQIGTVQDFYIVNNLWEPHPIHIHLINFQVVATYGMKTLPENQNCTLYMLDYFRMSGLPELQLSNSELCNYIWDREDEQVLSLFQRLKDYSFENITVDRNSGLDSMAPYNGDPAYSIEGCEWNTRYKYLCGNTTSSIPAYQRRWKDTFLIDAYTVAVMRVRWASTGYDESKQKYPFFNIPEDQLIEFPGFVYHCHILPHEDNEMMRPFMLTYSQEYLKHFNKYKKKGSCTGRSWLQSVTCINKRLGCAA